MHLTSLRRLTWLQSLSFLLLLMRMTTPLLLLLLMLPLLLHPVYQNWRPMTHVDHHVHPHRIDAMSRVVWRTNVTVSHLAIHPVW